MSVEHPHAALFVSGVISTCIIYYNLKVLYNNIMDYQYYIATCLNH